MNHPLAFLLGLWAGASIVLLFCVYYVHRARKRVRSISDAIERKRMADEAIREAISRVYKP